MKAAIPEIYVKDCHAALDFYKELFGGEIKNLQISDQLEKFQNIKNKVVHSELHVNKRCIFYFVDILDKRQNKTGNITIMLHMDSRQELDRIYHGMIPGADVDMALQKTMWGEYHAILTDRFGAPWSLNYAPQGKQS